MKNSTVLLSAILMVSSFTASATTVTWSGVPGARTVTLEGGVTTVPSGSLVLAGAFSNTAFAFNPLLDIATNFASISTAGGWKQFTLDTQTGTPDAGIINTATITASGKVGGQMTDNNNGPVTPTKADFFNGKQIYLWLFNGPSIAAATQMGIFTSTDAIVPWTFKTNAGGVGDSSSLSTVGTGGTPGAPTMVAAGTVGVGSTSSTTLQLVASTVPEPSVLALGGVAGLGMLASRKRRQRK